MTTETIYVDMEYRIAAYEKQGFSSEDAYSLACRDCEREQKEKSSEK